MTTALLPPQHVDKCERLSLAGGVKNRYLRLQQPVRKDKQAPKKVLNECCSISHAAWRLLLLLPPHPPSVKAAVFVFRCSAEITSANQSALRK